jgi:hypothetical protein
MFQWLLGNFNGGRVGCPLYLQTQQQQIMRQHKPNPLPVNRLADLDKSTL